MRERHGAGRSEANLSRTDPSEKGMSGTDPSQKGLSRTDTSEKGLSGAYSCQASTLNGTFNICRFACVCVARLCCSYQNCGVFARRVWYDYALLGFEHV